MEETGKEIQGDGNLSIEDTSSSHDILQIDSPTESSVPDSAPAMVSSQNLSGQDQESLGIADLPLLENAVDGTEDMKNDEDKKSKTEHVIDVGAALAKDTNAKENVCEIKLKMNTKLQTGVTVKVDEEEIKTSKSTDKVEKSGSLKINVHVTKDPINIKHEKLEKEKKNCNNGIEDELIVQRSYNIFKKKTLKIISDDTKEDYVELDSLVQELEDACNDTHKDKSPIKNVSNNNNNSEKKIENSLDNTKDSRCIWITNINPSTSANRLKFDLSKYGKVVNAKIMTNGDKYYGYALMDKAEDAKICIAKLDGLKINGFTVHLNTEQPQKSLKYSKKTEDKKSKTVVNREERLKSIKDAESFTDPLTLVVGEDKNRLKLRSRSSSRRRNINKKREEEERLKRQRINYLSRMKRREDMKKQREEEIKLKRQRELKLQLDIDKRKLEQDKRQFQKEKLEFIRQQRRLEEEKRAQERRDKILHEKELNDRKRAKSPINWKRSKSPTRKVNIAKTVPSIILDNRIQPRKRMSVSPLKSTNYKREMYRSPSPKRDRKIYQREHTKIVPPLPPRLTHSDIERLKADPWKSDTKKIKIDYYKSKDQYSSMNNLKKVQYHQSDNFNDKRYRDDRNSFHLKFEKEEDKYKDIKKRIFEPQYKEPHGFRSEVYHPQPRHSYTTSIIEPQRRFDTSYNTGQYNNDRYNNSNMGFSHFENSNWKQYNFNKEYPQTAPKMFNQEPARYDDFDKGHQYYAPRKY